MEERDQGGAHAGQLRVGERVLMHGAVGGVERTFKPCLRLCARDAVCTRARMGEGRELRCGRIGRIGRRGRLRSEVIKEGGDSEMACDLAARSPAHAIADHVSAELRREGAGVLIIPANATGVGAHGGD